MMVIPRFILTPAVFHILLALAGQERHGYAIMQRVNQDSQRRVIMGPGTLYGSIERMLNDGLIEESHTHIADYRRRYYRLTSLGKEALYSELDRYAHITRIAKDRRLSLEGPAE
jgi:DNA-binding PadR family transcriptional regulator